MTVVSEKTVIRAFESVFIQSPPKARKVDEPTTNLGSTPPGETMACR